MLATGFWLIGLIVAFGYYFVYPPEAEALHQQMESRRGMIVGGGD